MTLPSKTRRFNKPRTPGSLKEAFADLIAACGGVDRVADLLGKRKTQVYRYTDEAEEDSEMKPSQVRILETACGQPIVTTFLAAEQKCLLLRVEPLGDLRLDRDVARLGEEASKVFGRYVEGSADGKWSAKELAAMVAQSARAAAVLMAIRADCEALLKDLA